jgi:prepilin-type N-terminal cleavage/methylation domain-containing protein
VKNLTSQTAGFSLTEMIIATAVLSITGLAVFTLISIVNTRSTYLLALETRDSLQTEIMRTLEDEKAIQQTRAKDSIFNGCFKYARPAAGCPGQTDLGISLYNASGDKVAGPPNAPALYTLAGIPCRPNTPNANCLVQVTATVRAQGVPQWNNNQLRQYGDWSLHELVEVRYVVKIADNKLIPSNQRSVSGSYVYDTQDQMNSMNQEGNP